jgi:hypothetical protein
MEDSHSCEPTARHPVQSAVGSLSPSLVAQRRTQNTATQMSTGFVCGEVLWAYLLTPRPR